MSWIDLEFPRTATLSDRVGRVLGLNPGLLTGPGTNTYLVGTREPVLIDTGAGVPEYVPLLERYLAERGWPAPSRVLLTHRHRDHMGGLGQLRERFPGLPVAKRLHRDEARPTGVADLRDGQRIVTEGATLIALATPGHASDHLCFYLEEEQAVFTGDLVLAGSTSVIPPDDGDLGDYLASLRRLLGLPVRRLYPAHGPVIEDGPGHIAAYIDHRLMRERQILATLADGPATIPELVRRIYVDIAPALHPTAALSVEAHLRKLHREGRVEEIPQRGGPARWLLGPA